MSIPFIFRELKQNGPKQYWPKFIFKYPSLTTVIVIESLTNVSGMKGKKKIKTTQLTFSKLI